MNILIHYFDKKKTILIFMENPQMQENTNLCFVFLKLMKNYFFIYLFFVRNALTFLFWMYMHIQNHIFVFF